MNLLLHVLCISGTCFLQVLISPSSKLTLICWVYLIGQDVESYKQRIRELEGLVYKLNHQLSVCQAKHQHITDVNGNKVLPLPQDAPTPAWMVSL